MITDAFRIVMGNAGIHIAAGHRVRIRAVRREENPDERHVLFSLMKGNPGMIMTDDEQAAEMPALPG